MNSSGSELSWPTTTSHETTPTFCCFPRRRAPKQISTPQEKPRDDDRRPPPPKPPPAKQEDESNFIMLFNPEIPMTPNLARSNSDYVVDGFFFDSIRKQAYVTAQEGQAHVPCNTELNESFIPTGKRKRLMYVGFRYPDGTSLSYVPVRGVMLQHRRAAMSRAASFEECGRRLSSVYGRDYVYLSIPRAIYYVLVQMAEDVFNEKGFDTKSLLPDAEIRGDRVWLYNTEMKESCKVEGCMNGMRYAKTVLQAMKELGGDLEGDALLFMRFCEDLHSGDPDMKLQFRLHRMMVKGVSKY